MTKYPNSECDSHRDVTTSAPVCIVCMDREIEALRRDAERYRWLRDEAFQATAARIVQMLPGHMDAEIDAAMQGANYALSPENGCETDNTETRCCI